MGKKRENKVWQAAPLCHFWTIWKERNSRAFNNEEHSVQGIKFSFLYNLWALSKLFIALGPSSTVDFVDWMWDLLRGAVFCCPSLSFGGTFRCS